MLQKQRHSTVMAYNEHLKFMTTSLGLAMDLGDTHRTVANSALDQFEQTLFGEGRGITSTILQTISERYTEHAVDLPESWLAWPITAGGLGLRLAAVMKGQYQIAFEKRKKARKPIPDKRPDDWQYGDSEWSAFYEDQLVSLTPAECRDSTRLKQLVESFIARGKSISGGQQDGLSEYWRWVLSIHGPVILDRFGTFEFLLSDLVPLQLIQEKLLQRGANTSASESEK